MKRLHYIALSLMAGLSITTSAQAQMIDNSLRFDPSADKAVSTQVVNPRVTIMEGKTNNLPMLAQKLYKYRYDLYKDCFILGYTTDFKYNDFNRTTIECYRNYSEDGSLTYLYDWHFSYDDQHRLVENVRYDAYGNETDWTNAVRNKHFYDDFIPEFEIAYDHYEWDIETRDWVHQNKGSNYKEIIRDSQNRVISCQTWAGTDKSVPGIGFYYEYDENGGNDGHPVKACFKVVDESGNLKDAVYYTDMKWYKCDNQMTSTNNKKYFSQSYHLNSLPASYNVYEVLDDGSTQLNAEVYYVYDEHDRSVQELLKLPILGYDVANVKDYSLGENGSYEFTFTHWNDENGDGVFQESEAVMSGDNEKAYYYYDAVGNLYLSTDYLFNEETQQYDIETKRLERDIQYLEDNTLKEYTESSYEYGELDYRNKYVYEDFIDRVDAGIKDAESSELSIRIEDDRALVNGSEGAAYVIYDIQGRMVKSGTVKQSEVRFGELVPGAYILHIGNASYKLLKK